MRRTTTTVASVATIFLALLTVGAFLAVLVLLIPRAGLATHCYGAGGTSPASPHCYDKEITGTPTDDSLKGTSGDDLWVGTDGADTIYGKGGDDLIGRDVHEEDWGFEPSDDPGADTYYGGDGEDVLDGNHDGHVDTIDCGAGGEDLASFEKGSDNVKTKTCERLDWTDKELRDCAVKPWDNADVQCKTGTKRADELLGNNDPDILILDAMWGKGGNDILRGRRGFDGLEGGPGDDTLYGGPGDDTLYGNEFASSSDKNYIQYSDKVYGGDGDDRIDVSDLHGSTPRPAGTPVPDTISCGAGDHDWGLIDSGVDQDPQGVTLIIDHRDSNGNWVPGEHGQSGCEFLDEETDFRFWWKHKKKK